MKITKKFLQLTSKTYPHGTENQLKNHLPEGYKEDGYGNFYIEIGENSTTMFTCHLDTADRVQVKVKHVFQDNIIKTDGNSILGADDKAGMTVMLYMIKKGVPGLYYFFIGEERGCVGSRRVSQNWNSFEFSDRITKCISFDRRGTDSIITEQFYGVCCSMEFARELSNRLNSTKQGFKYSPDPTGIYTDSAQFTGLIPECTNISVGYYNEHTETEKQDIEHLKKLCLAVCEISWEDLPISRVATVDDYFDDEDEDDVWVWDENDDWSVDYYSYFSTGNNDTVKLFISRSQIDEESKLIQSWVVGSGIYPGFKGLVWNGNSLYIESASGVMEYVATRMELIDMVPQLSEVTANKVRPTL